MENFEVQKPHNRLRGDLPKVGIRPAIDGRLGGVRESLEAQVMDMAKNAAKLIAETLRHPDGTQVECVIADSCIGCVAEAAQTADKFRREGVGVSLTVTPCWCYGSETIDMDPFLPKAIWGFNGTERPGAVYLAAALAGHAQKGLPAFGIYGRDVQAAGDPTIPDDVKGKILQFVKAGLAAAALRGKSYLSIGSVSMGIAGSIVNEDFFQKYFGMRNEYADMSEITRRIERGIFDKKEFEHALAWTKKYCKEDLDANQTAEIYSRQTKDKNWNTAVQMALIVRDLMVGNPRLKEMGFGEEALGHNAIAAGFQGQRQWTDHSPNGDFLEAILNSSFDWSGIRQLYIVATENDSLNAVVMLFGHLLANTAQIFADVRTYWSPDALQKISAEPLGDWGKQGLLHLTNSAAAPLDGTGKKTKKGKPAMKPYYDITEKEAKDCLAATSWPPAISEYFRGGGYSSKYLSKGGMPMTMMRLNLVRGLGPTLQLVEGYSADIPKPVHDAIDKRTNETWPTTWFAPNLTFKGSFKDVYSVMKNWGANHGAISYGHIGSEVITLCSMLRIPVCMHNVEDEKIFRPAAWSAFGTQDLEGADYRACQAYGALYR